MVWDSEIDLLAGAKGVAKQGRRASKSTPRSSETPPKSGGDSRPEVRGGWWSDESKKSTKTKTVTNTFESDPLEDLTKLDSDDDIPVIPDIDDVQEDLSTLREIKVPISSINKSTYKELDSELSITNLSSGPKGKHGTDVDCSFLSKEALKNYTNFGDVDDHTPWTEESLLEELIKTS